MQYFTKFDKTCLNGEKLLFFSTLELSVTEKSISKSTQASLMGNLIKTNTSNHIETSTVSTTTSTTTTTTTTTSTTVSVDLSICSLDKIGNNECNSENLVGFCFFDGYDCCNIASILSTGLHAHIRDAPVGIGNDKNSFMY